MQALLAVRILIPGVWNFFLNLIGVSGIDWQNFREILVEDNPAREFELRRIVDAILRDVAVSHEVAQAAAELGPLGIEGSDGQQIGQVKSLDDRECVFDEPVHEFEALNIDGVVALQVDG